MGRIYVDLAKCDGCRVCEAVCSLYNEGEINPEKSRIKVVRVVERNILYSIPVLCLQCEEANCEAVCPAHAIKRDERGILIIDEEKCVGCGNCQLYCPEGTVLLTEEKKVIFDYRYCKGCGVCANECPVNAIAMVKEGEQ